MENQTDNNPGATPAPDAANVIRDQVEAIEAVNRRLYALAEDDLGDSPAGEEAESCARALSYVQEALENNAPKLTTYHDPEQLSTPYVVAPDLSNVPLIAIEDELQRRGFGFLLTKNGKAREAGVSTDDLAQAIYCRQRAGDCVALVITPNDLAEYWDCDDSGATNPASRIPEAGEMHAISKAFERWQDSGAGSEVYEVCRDAWQAEQARQLDEGDAK
jgi:hypothetical protein